MHIIVLLTAQHDESNPWLPNHIGIKRAEAAARRLGELPESKLTICGGYRNHFGFSYADRLAVWFADHYPLLMNRLILVTGGSSNNSKHDLRQVHRILRDVVWPHEPPETTMHLATERQHFNRSKLTAELLGYKTSHADSMANAGSLYSPSDDIMAQQTDPDIIMGRGADQVFWNQKSDESAENQRVFCAEWALKHPELDRNELYRIAASINHWRSKGIRFA